MNPVSGFSIDRAWGDNQQSPQALKLELADQGYQRKKADQEHRGFCEQVCDGF